MDPDEIRVLKWFGTNGGCRCPTRKLPEVFEDIAADRLSDILTMLEDRGFVESAVENGTGWLVCTPDGVSRFNELKESDE